MLSQCKAHEGIVRGKGNEGFCKRHGCVLSGQDLDGLTWNSMNKASILESKPSMVIEEIKHFLFVSWIWGGGDNECKVGKCFPEQTYFCVWRVFLICSCHV